MPVRRRLRASLAITTTLVSWSASGAANAQSLPIPVPIVPPIPAPPAPPALPTLPAAPSPPQLSGLNNVIAAVASGGSGKSVLPDVARVGQTLNVALHATSTVIDWNGFNVPKDATANFTDGRNAGNQNPASQIAVLNRDLSGNVSQILGNLRSDANVAVWLLNGSGILVGGNAVINTGSLVLSTLDMRPADFLANTTGTYRLSAAGTSMSAITVAQGARVTVTGGNRGLVLLAPAINANGSFTAATQDIAFVTATDVSLTYQAGSPLSVAIDRGTAVGGQSQVVGGTVDGRNALFALASQASVTDALLRVDARVTTAVAGARGIVLSAGATGSNAPGLVVRGAASDTGGVAGLRAGGALTATGTSADVVARATGGAALTGDLSAGGDVAVDAGAAAFVTGNVTAGGNFSVGGAGVTLGGAAPVAQRADGAVYMVARAGSVFGTTGLTLQSNADGVGSEALDLAASDGITFAPSTALLAGTARQSNLRIRNGSGAGGVTLGRVEANRLLGAVGVDAFGEGLRRTSALVIGDVHVNGPLLLEGAGISTGSIESGAAVRLTSFGALTATGITARDDIALVGTGATTVGGLVKSGGSITVDRDGAARFVRVEAKRDVVMGDSVAPSSLQIDFATAGGIARLASTGAIRLDGNVSAATLSVRGGSIALGATGTYTSAGSIDLAAQTGGITTGSGVTIRSTSANAADSMRIQGNGAQGIQFAPDTRIVAGADRTLVVGVRVAPGAPLLLGSVDARALVGLPAPDGAVGGDAIATDGLLRFGALNLRNSFRAATTGGELRVGSINVDGARQGIELRAANGLLTVPSTLTADGAIVLESGRDLRFDTVTSRNGSVSVSSTGLLDARSLTGPGGVVAFGRSMNIGTVRGGRVDLIATGGDLVLDSAFGADVALQAAGGASVTGQVRANGGYSVVASRVTLGGTQSANGALAIRSTAGDIVGGSGLVLTADADGTGGEALSLDAAGTVTVAGDTRLVGGASRGGTVSVVGGPGLTLGAVDASSLVIGGTAATGAVVTGDLSLVNDLTLTGAGGVQTGDITIASGGVRLDAGAAALRTGSIAAAGDVRLSGARVGFGAIAANGVETSAGNGGITGDAITSRTSALLTSSGGVAIDAIDTAAALRMSSTSGGIRVGSATVGTDATLTTTGAPADIVVTRGLNARGTARLASTGSIRAPFITAGRDLYLTAAGDLSAVDPAGRTSLTAGPGAAFVLDIGGAARIDSLTGASVFFRANTIDLRSVDAGTGDVDLRALAGDLSIAGLVRGGTVSLAATGGVDLGTVTASGALTMNGATRLTFGDVMGAGVVATSGGALTGRSVTSANGATLTAVGGLSLGALTTTAGGAVLTADGDATLGAATVAGTLTLNGANIKFGDLTANGFTAQTGGAITGRSVTSSNGATLTATGPLSLDALKTSAGSATVTSTGAATLGTASVAGDLALTGGTGLTFGDVTAGGFTAKSGGALAGRSVTSANAASLTAKGPLSLDALTVKSGEAVVEASGIASLGAASVAGRLVLTGGTGVTFGDLASTGFIATSGGAMTGRSVTSANGATLTATGPLSLDALTTSAGGGAVTSLDTVTLAKAAVVGDLALAGGTGLTFGEIIADGVMAKSGGALTGRTVTAATGATLMAQGPLSLDTLSTKAGDATVDSKGTAALGTATVAGRLVLASAAGLTFGDLTSGGLAATSGGAMTGHSVTSSNGATLTSAGALTLSRLKTSTGSASLNSGSDAKLGSADVADALNVSSTGAVEVYGVVRTGGRYSVSGATVALGAERQQAGGALAIVASGGDISGLAGLALSGSGVSLNAQGALALANTTVDARGADLGLRAGSGKAITLGRVDARTIGSIRADDGVADTLTHDGATTITTANLSRLAVALGTSEFRAGTLTIADAARIEGGTVAVDKISAGTLAVAATRDLTLGSATSGGGMSLTSGGGVSLTDGRATGAISIDAAGLARLGRITAGPSLRVRAGDAELTGIQHADAIAIENGAAGTRALRIGDGTGGDGFRLSNAEVGLLEADTLVLSGGTGAVELGALAFGANAGRRQVDVLSTGVMTVTGIVSGTGRAFRLGGTAASENAGASDLRVVATSTGGGRLLFDGADLELRADRIAVGLGSGFVDRLTGANAGGQAAAMVGNANSALYNANLGGGFFALANPTTVSARSLTVRYGEFALFQNTALAGGTSGAILGGTIANPVKPALTLIQTGSTGANSFALFGTVNGIGATPTALLGSDALSLGMANAATTRINGCLIGSGGGCLRTVVIQPRLQVFDQSREEVFGVARDLTVPFDPLIGGNNEEFLIDIDTVEIEPEPVLPPPVADEIDGKIGE